MYVTPALVCSTPRKEAQMELFREYKIAATPSQWAEAKQAAKDAGIPLREWMRLAIAEKLEGKKE